MDRSPRRLPVRARLSRLPVRVAAPAGRVARVALLGATGVGGPVLVCVGLGLAWAPLGFVAAGVFLLAADRRL